MFSEIRHYLGTYDVLGMDPYPIPKKPIETVISSMRQGIAGTFGTKAIWQVPQAFGWGWLKRKETKGQRAPTQKEMSNMTWQSIAGGANGIVYYAYHHLSEPHEDPNDAFAPAWARTKAAAAEVKKYEQVLLSADPIAFAPLSGVWGAEEKPLLKIGLMTDTHVGKTKASCARARLAYELFRDIGVDLIVNDGDVADHHYPTGYVAYREMVEETFAGVPAAERPQELFVYAWHDAFDYKNHPRGDAQKDAPEAFAEMQELIKSPNGPYAEGEIKGFPYVVIPQFYGRKGQVDWNVRSRSAGCRACSR